MKIDYKFLAAVFMFLISFTSLWSQDDDPKELNAQQIFERNKPSLVSIWITMDGYFSYYSFESKDTTILSGSGFIFTEDGFVGTNYHVIEGYDSVLIKTSDSVFYNSVLIYFDAKADIAILKIVDTTGADKKFPYITFSDADSVKIGQSVFAIGSPLGYEYTISEGIIAGLRFNEKVSYYAFDYSSYEKVFEKVIQITAAISPGNSGGALFNNKGSVIGITTYSYGFYGNLNFAIGINNFIKIVNNINLKDLENDSSYKKKREEDFYITSLKRGNSYLSRLRDSWIYSKQRDTMKIYDTVIVKKDSLNKIYYWRSESAFQKNMQTFPDSFDAYSGLMDLFITTENYPKAEDLYKQIKEKFTSDSLINTLSSSIASSYIARKDYASAIQLYEKMTKIDTADYYYHYQIASTYELMGNYKSALNKYAFLMKKDTSNYEPIIKSGLIYYKHIKDKKKAKEFLNRAYEKSLKSQYSYLYGTTNAEMLYYLGMIAVEDGRKMEAILFLMELKTVYLYDEKEVKLKLDLYKAITEMKD